MVACADQVWRRPGDSMDLVPAGDPDDAPGGWHILPSGRLRPVLEELEVVHGPSHLSGVREGSRSSPRVRSCQLTSRRERNHHTRRR